MRKFFAVLAALALVAAFSSTVSFAQKETTVSGKVIDGQCYFGKVGEKAALEGHDNCNMKCAKSGSPLAIYTSKDEVYTITGDFTKDNNAKLLDFVSKQVVASGHVMEKDGKKELHLMSIKPAKTE